MFRVFVVALPILLTLGVTYVSWMVALEGSDSDRLKKLLVGALVLGVLGSLLIWRQQSDTNDELNQMRKASASTTASQAAQTNHIKQDDEKIDALNAQVATLQAQLKNNPQGANAAVATAPIKQQSAVLPKIYWTQADEAGGTTAVRFKIYGPLNIPAFVAICDRPCRATHGEIGSGSEGQQVVGATGKVAGYVFNKPRPIQAGTEGFVIVEPGSAKVTEFRVLSDTEIPPFLK
jgi:hypothetical protein